jgi:hypothetical protein
MAVLDAIRRELRRKPGYYPVVWDLQGQGEKDAGDKDVTDRISTLARFARFVVLDLADTKAIPEGVLNILLDVPVPVKPLLMEVLGKEPSVLHDLREKRRPLLDTFRYKGVDDLVASFQKECVAPAEEIVQTLRTEQRASASKWFRWRGSVKPS